MLKINVILVLCVIGLCTAATTPKTKEAVKKNDGKEKRDAAIQASSPYSYDTPQKHYQVQAQPQKSAQIEYQQTAAQKVAPLVHYQQQQQAPIHVAPQQQYYEQAQHQQAPQHYQASYAYPSEIEGLLANYKGFEYNYNFPSFESYEQMPVVHYSQDLKQGSNPFGEISGYKSQSPSFSSYKASSPFQQPYSFGSPSPAYSFPAQSYAHPQHLEQHQQHYAPSAPSGPAAGHYFGFSQQPSEIFVPQTISIPAKQTKIPDYASGVKGLGHFSTIGGYDAPASVPIQPAYVKHSYEAPAYAQHYQTEKPFRASTYLGASKQYGYDSHSEQSIANIKPAGQYLPPSKTYLPSKVEYSPPTKTYLPSKVEYSPPTKTYLPSKVEYSPPSKTYLPSKVEYSPPSKTYLPSKEHHYVPEQSPVEYQIQYIQVPQKSYVPTNNYLPPKSEQPKSSYLPPKKTYLPPSQPTKQYLPPNNPYQSNYLQSSSHSVPAQQYQHYQQQDSYESQSQEYQSVTPSGHK